MKIIFFGSDDFANVHLKALIASTHRVLACVTQPDRPKGRGMSMVPSIIKQTALENNIPVLQPENIKDSSFTEQLKNFQADVFVVIAYGKILPQHILDIPKMSINVHGSLLPKYRGAAPIHWAIINGEKETGLSIIRMTSKMDAGDIIAQQKIPIQDTDTTQTLRQTMMTCGADLLLQTLSAIEQNKFTLQSQNEKDVTIASKLSKTLGEINWAKPAKDIYNLARGLTPWPGVYTFYNGKVLKILACDFVGDGSSTAGTILTVDKDGIHVATGRGVLILKDVQLEGAKRMDAYSFSLGHQIEPGFKFGK